MTDYSTGYKCLREFVLSEMQIRGMSAREFAAFVGVAHTTVNKCLKGVEGNPSVDFVFKLSKATGVAVSTIMSLMQPDAESVDPSPELQILAKRFASLPQQIQTALWSLVLKDF